MDRRSADRSEVREASKARSVPKNVSFGVSSPKTSTSNDFGSTLPRRSVERPGKCQPWRASGRAQAPAGARYSAREMPSFFIFQYNIERFIPSRAAAPLGPPTTQSVSRRAPRMCSRSASASVSVEVGDRRSEISGPFLAAGFSPPTSDP